MSEVNIERAFGARRLGWNAFRVEDTFHAEEMVKNDRLRQRVASGQRKGTSDGA